jgi:hypothetical protein
MSELYIVTVKLGIFLDREAEVVHIYVKVGLVQQKGFRFSISAI